MNEEKNVEIKKWNDLEEDLEVTMVGDYYWLSMKVWYWKGILQRILFILWTQIDNSNRSKGLIIDISGMLEWFCSVVEFVVQFFLLEFQ